MLIGAVISRGPGVLQAPQAGAPITVWVKRMDVTGASYGEVESVDLQQTVSKFRARWVAQEQLDVDPSLVTLRLVKCGPGKPTPAQEAKAEVLDDPSLNLAEAHVTGTAWLLADTVQAEEAERQRAERRALRGTHLPNTFHPEPPELPNSCYARQA